MKNTVVLLKVCTVTNRYRFPDEDARMRILLSGLAMTMALGLAGCGGGGEPTDAEYPRGITADTIKIGSHTDLSGPIAIWGVPMINGMRQRFDELPPLVEFMVGRSISSLRIRSTRYRWP